jgi:hypothetical protein
MGPLGRATRPRAGLLFEVVMAMTVLVTAMGFLGAQLCTGLNMTTYAEDQMRAAQVADYVLALVEFDLDTQALVFTDEEENEYEFPDTAEETAYWRLPERFPGYFWRVRVEPAEPNRPETELQLVTVEILYQSDPDLRDSIDDAKLQRQVSFLHATPPRIDTSALQLGGEGLDNLPDELTGLLPDLLGMLDGAEAGGLSIHELVSMLDAETMQQFMPLLQQLMGGEFGDLSSADLNNLISQMGGGGFTSSGGLQQFMPGFTGGAGEGRGGRGSGGNSGSGGGAGSGGRGAQGGGQNAGGDGAGRGGRNSGGITLEDLIRMRDEMQRQEGG